MPTKERLANNRARALEDKRMQGIFKNARKPSAADMEMTIRLCGDKSTAFFNTNLVKFNEEGQPYPVAICATKTLSGRGFQPFAHITLLFRERRK